MFAIPRRRLNSYVFFIEKSDLLSRLAGRITRNILQEACNILRGAPLSAYLYAVLQANSRSFKEMRAMANTSFEAVLEECGLAAPLHDLSKMVK
jgi:hypothetical protein